MLPWNLRLACLCRTFRESSHRCVTKRCTWRDPLQPVLHAVGHDGSRVPGRAGAGRAGTGVLRSWPLIERSGSENNAYAFLGARPDAAVRLTGFRKQKGGRCHALRAVFGEIDVLRPADDKQKGYGSCAEDVYSSAYTRVLSSLMTGASISSVFTWTRTRRSPG